MRISPINSFIYSRKINKTPVVQNNNFNLTTNYDYVTPSFKSDNKKKNDPDYICYPILTENFNVQGMKIFKKTKNIDSVELQLYMKDYNELFVNKKNKFDIFAFKHFLNIFAEYVDEKYDDRKKLSEGFVLEVTEQKNGNLVKRDEFDKENMQEVFASVQEQCDIPEVKNFFADLLAASQKEITLTSSDIDIQKENALCYMRLSKTRNGYNYGSKDSKKFIIMELFGVSDKKKEIDKLHAASESVLYSRDIDFIKSLNSFVMQGKLRSLDSYKRPAEILKKYIDIDPKAKGLTVSYLSDFANVCSVENTQFEELFDCAINKKTNKISYELLLHLSSIYSICDNWSQSKFKEEFPEIPDIEYDDFDKKEREDYYNNAKVEMVKDYMSKIIDRKTGTRVGIDDLISPSEYFDEHRWEYEEIDPTENYDDN